MADKLLISFVLIAYNQERFIREAVEGAFSQTYSPLEIILSDDASSDRWNLPIAEKLAGSVLSLPMGPHLSCENAASITESIIRSL